MQCGVGVAIVEAFLCHCAARSKDFNGPKFVRNSFNPGPRIDVLCSRGGSQKTWMAMERRTFCGLNGN